MQENQDRHLGVQEGKVHAAVLLGPTPCLPADVFERVHHEGCPSGFCKYNGMDKRAGSDGAGDTWSWSVSFSKTRMVEW